MRYLLPTAVVDYIEQNDLYLEDGASSNNTEKGKERDSPTVAARKESISASQS